MEKRTTTEATLRNLIERIQRIRNIKAILSKEEQEISTPLIGDLEKVDEFYDFFVSFYKGRKAFMARKQFIFITLYFFSPNALGGSKMRRGLREKLAKILNCTCSNISHEYKFVSFYYNTYNRFRHEVNEAIDKLLRDLDIKPRTAHYDGLGI